MNPVLHSFDTLALRGQLDGGFAERTLVLRQARQVVREAGADGARAPTLVLLHGIGSGAPSWLAVARQLAARARVLAWDAPGYGNSTPLPMAQPRAEDYALRLGQTLDALGVEHCVLVGHSLGAHSALALACAQPRRVRRLVLISPAAGYGQPGAEQARLAVRERRLLALDSLGIDGMARERSAHLLSPAASAEQLAWVRWNMARLNASGYRQAIELLCAEDLLRHGVPAVPTQVFCGEHDTITTPEACQRIAAGLASPFSLIEGAGHASPVEQPLQVSRLLAAALNLAKESDDE
ncbi:alpha/beta fold hydrolase [Pseudomonas typographi]|uniref:alpha/beta fold hydrolase n=1 Tax=Pseudomonas typographi TaxID=2715964 RepID=UPI00168521EC|nr:alpha/beta fold hydrolase [Pseudomonas typographi]MBD1551601.1 alpha/beta fold hydrolase [Pseudomonas typographi]MBD1589814.1 alpha/beta fold hydrolase [Pseudomonas typographi]